jgi:hypothetical protein
MGLTGISNLFALMKRTFPAMGLSHLSGVDLRHSRTDNSLTAPVCPARKGAQQDLAAQQG